MFLRQRNSSCGWTLVPSFEECDSEGVRYERLPVHASLNWEFHWAESMQTSVSKYTVSAFVRYIRRGIERVRDSILLLKRELALWRGMKERERKREIGERECNYSGKYGKFTKHLPTLNTTMENLLAPLPLPHHLSTFSTFLN